MMPVSSLKKVLLPSALIAGAIFSALTLPLVTAGSENLAIQIKQERVYEGTLKDIATPYIGFAAAVGLGAGLVNMSIAGWMHSSRKSRKFQETLSTLQDQLKEKEAQIEEILMSESRLQSVGLHVFLDEEEGRHSSQTFSLASPADQSAMIAQHDAAVDSTAVSIEAISAAIQAEESAKSDQITALGTPGVSQVEQLQDQLKQMMSQVEQLQSALQSDPQPTLEQLAQPEFTDVVLLHLNRRLHQLESQWATQKLAS